jgi:hypothetical protein
MLQLLIFSTYDHRTLKTRLPVRSALFKQRTGGLVVRWVTTGESPLLYVFDFFFLLPRLSRGTEEKTVISQWHTGYAVCEDAERWCREHIVSPYNKNSGLDYNDIATQTPPYF